jgi:hypothetical protein
MKTRKVIPSVIAAFACLSGAAGAADIFGGNGIGFSNNTVNPGTGAYSPGPWVANIVFNKQDLRAGAAAVIKTGDDITPAAQAEAAKNGGISLIVPPTKSMAWCDPASNPDNPGNTDISQCYGWAMHSKWVVLDFNALQKAGLTNVYVSITAKRYNDNDAVATDDDLVPALTVFQGRQDQGASLHWYPNKFQKQPFWAWKLTPFAGGATKSNGWATGYMAGGSMDSANVTGRLKLKPGGQNYLTVAVGGDARDPSAKHDANFELDVALSKKAPKESSGSGSGGTGAGSAAGKYDKCGCEIGVKQWHPSMNHCMAIELCAPIAGTADQCKTPEMCERDGGR